MQYQHRHYRRSERRYRLLRSRRRRHQRFGMFLCFRDHPRYLDRWFLPHLTVLTIHLRHHHLNHRNRV